MNSERRPRTGRSASRMQREVDRQRRERDRGDGERRPRSGRCTATVNSAIAPRRATRTPRTRRSARVAIATPTGQRRRHHSSQAGDRAADERRAKQQSGRLVRSLRRRRTRPAPTSSASSEERRRRRSSRASSAAGARRPGHEHAGSRRGCSSDASPTSVGAARGRANSDQSRSPASTLVWHARRPAADGRRPAARAMLDRMIEVERPHQALRLPARGRRHRRSAASPAPSPASSAPTAPASPPPCG